MVPPKDDAINHPPHYGGDIVYEPIKFISFWKLTFNLGNCVKYIVRAGVKDKAKKIEDLKKAQFYLNYEIQLLEGTREV